MGDCYKKGIDMYEKEYEKLVEKGTMSASDLELHGKLLDAIKDAYKICKMKEESGYDEDVSGRRGYGMMRSRYYPSMGEYYVEGSYAPYNWQQSNGPYMRGYSSEGNYGRGMSNASSGLKTKLHQLMNETTNDQEKMMIQSWINDMGNL